MKHKYTSEQITDLAKKYRSNPTQANATAVLVSMVALCKWWVNKRRVTINASRIEFDDLLQEAKIGVLNALDKYDGQHAFAPYAYWSVKKHIVRHIEAESSVLTHKPSKYSRQISSRYGYMYDKIKRGNPYATRDEVHQLIADELEIGKHIVDGVSAQTRGCVSLDSPLSTCDGDNPLTLINIMSDGIDHEEKMNDTLQCDQLKSVLARIAYDFDARKKRIAYRRLLGDTEDTLESLGGEFGITRERVRQIESDAREELMFWGRREMGL